MATDYEIKKMHEAKIKRLDDSSSSAKKGGFMHDAVSLFIGLNDKKEEKNIDEIKISLINLLEMIYEVDREVSGIPISTFSEEEKIKANEDWKQKYEDLCKAEDIKAEEKLPIIKVD